jgi:ferredoxin-fold anticodon binding domain-containing protein
MNLSVELTHTSNMRFMKFDAGIVETLLEDDDKDEEAWKRKSVKVSISTDGSSQPDVCLVLIDITGRLVNCNI